MDINSVVECFSSIAQESYKDLNSSKSQEEYNSKQRLMLDNFRNQLEPYVYNYLLYTYGAKLETFWKTHEFPKKSKYAWVLVERRIHPNLWFVLRNLAWAGPHMSLYIYCSDCNVNYVRELLGDKVKNVHILQIFSGVGTREQGKNEYQVVHKQPDFYRNIDAEYMIRIEVDCYLRRKIPDEVFVTDFYGAPWGWYPDKPGGGGLSIRRVAAMIEICEKLNDFNTIHEDGWFSDRIPELGYEFPGLNHRIQVFSENFPVDNPIGVHQFWTFLGNFNLDNKEQFKDHLRRYLTLEM